MGFRKTSIVLGLIAAATSVSAFSQRSVVTNANNGISLSGGARPTSSLNMAEDYSIADQVERFANANAEKDERFLNIDSVYSGNEIMGKRVLVTGGNRGL